MSTKIYYFTGSGNSLDVARELSRELGTYEAISMVKAYKEGIDLDADSIGLVFPVYVWGVPRFVVEFLKKIKTDKYVFAVATCGGAPGGTLPQAKRILKQVGTSLSAGWSIIMPNSYTPMGEAEPTDVQEKKFDNMRRRVREITEAVRKKEKGTIEKNSALYNFLFTTIIYNMYKPVIARQSNKFHLNDNCKGCGTCVRVCPMENIELKNEKPEWGKNCTICLGCMQWCPSHAIEFGRGTRDKKRYHNPHVGVNDVMMR